MSAPEPPEKQAPGRPPSGAGAIVAQQIEKIIEASRASAEQVAAAAQAEAAEVKRQAQQSAQAELAAARRSVVRMGEEAHEEAAARVADAQTAADEALADAKAVSAGLRQLAQLLTVNAERILRDVQNSHRAITANLRAAGDRAGRARVEDDGDDESPDEDAREAAPARGRPRRDSGGNPFEELEPPAWVEK
jgi:hypothetical protein